MNVIRLLRATDNRYKWKSA